MTKTKYNPERRDWRGRSYKNGGKRVSSLKDIDRDMDNHETDERSMVTRLALEKHPVYKFIGRWYIAISRSSCFTTITLGSRNILGWVEFGIIGTDGSGPGWQAILHTKSLNREPLSLKDALLLLRNEIKKEL